MARARKGGCGTFSDRFAALAGTWDLVREASDGSVFKGQASFEPAGAQTLLLEETGELRLAGHLRLAAHRSWVWRLTGQGLLDIRYPPFEGGRTYHRFAPHRADGAWHGEAEHLCGADRYRGDYRFADAEIRVIHHVEGPAKRYRLTGRFTRRAKA